MSRHVCSGTTHKSVCSNSLMVMLCELCLSIGMPEVPGSLVSLFCVLSSRDREAVSNLMGQLEAEKRLQK